MVGLHAAKDGRQLRWEATEMRGLLTADSVPPALKRLDLHWVGDPLMLPWLAEVCAMTEGAMTYRLCNVGAALPLSLSGCGFNKRGLMPSHHCSSPPRSLFRNLCRDSFRYRDACHKHLTPKTGELHGFFLYIKRMRTPLSSRVLSPRPPPAVSPHPHPD